MFFLTLRDQTGFVQCVWFEGVQWYKNAFEVGELLAISAVPTLDNVGRPQFVHPEYDRLRGTMEEDEPDWGNLVNTGAIIPKYPSGSELGKAGLDSRGFRRIIRRVLRDHTSVVDESLTDAIRKNNGLIDLKSALQMIHFPESFARLAEAQKRLKFDELFFFQLMLALRRRQQRDETKGISYPVESKLARTLVERLPFELTSAQKRVMREIAEDMRSPSPMNRLLQGDVGSGKTIVALAMMLVAVDHGYQVALMAPTEILAEQHYRTLTAFLKDLSVSVRLLLGGGKKKPKQDALDDVKSGKAQIIVGTHALIEEAVTFAKLGLAVIDEQHRFGVLQRAKLREKGYNPDILVMTATPIPRTLAMTVYGDLDLSVIDEMPARRIPVRTAIRLDHQKEKVFEFVKQEVLNGRQAYIVFPLIEESEKVDLKAATGEFERLQREVFPELKLGLLHGRLKVEEKDAVMRRFLGGELQILVSTTVIEVGIDVPNASVMIIENAERFGLSQLHQLRGRVGRGAEQSYCILIADYGWFDRSKKRPGAEAEREKQDTRVRLETMVATADGFRIAEVDLKLRGPGEFFGTKQSGLPDFRIADLVEDADVVRVTRQEAFDLVERDPQLRKAEHASLRKHVMEHYREQMILGSIG